MSSLTEGVLMQLFKVLGPHGQSVHGGTHLWGLPTLDAPGPWTLPLTPAICSSGYHLVDDPLEWRVCGAPLLLAGGRGAFSHNRSGKVSFEQVRLLEEIRADWPLLFAFPRLQAFLYATSSTVATRVQLADLSEADLSGADLSGAGLSGADLSGADLSKADLSGADLSGAHLGGAGLHGAVLSEADLSEADLRGAYLSKADLHGA